jgi:hypothetical protein
MIQELEMAVLGVPHLPEEDQVELLEAILTAFERRGVVQPNRLETIVF